MQNGLKKLKSGTDVRGIAVGNQSDVNLTDEAVTSIVKAFLRWLESKTGRRRFKIAVGNDSRISAERIVSATLSAITSSGCDAVYTGLSSTPSMFVLLTQSDFACDASVMITASHMPYDRNGLKFFTVNGGISGEDLDEILNIAEKGDFLSGNGTVTERSFMDDYSGILVNTVEKSCGKMPLSGKKVIVDAGNGAGGFFVEKVLKPLGADVSGSQFLEPDGRFKNHIPNPEDKTAILSLRNAVLKNSADLGIIFDTDVDRAACVDSSGEEINKNSLIALISAILLKKGEGVIVTDSVTSEGLTEFIKKKGGTHLRYKRGYKNVIDKCKELNASGIYSPIAIETSGHAAFKENYYLDDGAYLTVKLLISMALQAKEGKTLTSLISDLKRPAEENEVRISFNNLSSDFRTEGYGVLEVLKSRAESDNNMQLASDNYEGVKFAVNGCRIIVRMSVHDPVMPIYLESDYKGGTREAAKILLSLLKDFDFLDLTNLQNFITSSL